MKQLLETKETHLVGEFSAIWPEATEEMAIEVGKQILGPFKIYKRVNSCIALLEKVIAEGTQEQKDELEAKLLSIDLELIADEEGKLAGTMLRADDISKRALTGYSSTSTEYFLACYFTGKLQEKLNTYSGPGGSDDPKDMILGIVSQKLAQESTVEECLERISQIITPA